MSVPESSGAAEGETQPAGLSDEETPPEPPEVQAMRERRERILQEGRRAQAVIDGWPDDSPWKVFVRYERDRDKRLEPLRAALIKSKKKGESK
jgi:hypothetical protein